MLINRDSAALTDLYAGHLCQGCFRTHTNGKYHDVCRMHFPFLCKDFERSGGRLPESGNTVVGLDINAMLCQVLFHKPCHFSIERGHHLRKFFNQRNAEAPLNEVLRHFQTDESAPDNNRTLWF